MNSLSFSMDGLCKPLGEGGRNGDHVSLSLGFIYRNSFMDPSHKKEFAGGNLRCYLVADPQVSITTTCLGPGDLTKAPRHHPIATHLTACLSMPSSSDLVVCSCVRDVDMPSRCNVRCFEKSDIVELDCIWENPGRVL